MSASAKTCPKCGGRMGQGFLLEMIDHNFARATKWVEGAVERSWTGAVKRRGREELTVESYRCERCHYLESYAPPPANES